MSDTEPDTSDAFLTALAECHRPTLEPAPGAALEGDRLVHCPACDGPRKRLVRPSVDPIPVCQYWATAKARGLVTDQTTHPTQTRPIAYAEHDGRSWRCDGCGSHGRACGGTDIDGRDRAAETIKHHINDCTPGRTDRDRIIDALRGLAAAYPVNRVWGRLSDATPHQAQEGNAWAANVEDIADIVLHAIGRH